MRALKLILASLFAVIAAGVALAAGFFAAAVVAITGLAVYLARRFLGRAPTTPPRAASGPRVRSMGRGETIEITATEVPTEPLGAKSTVARE